MEDLNVVDSINGAGTAGTQPRRYCSACCEYCCGYPLLSSSAIVARVNMTTVNRLMRARVILMRQWPTFFLRWCAMGLSLFTLIAALGRVGFQTASVCRTGRRWFDRWHSVQGSLSNLLRLGYC